MKKGVDQIDTIGGDEKSNIILNDGAGDQQLSRGS
jgi:hypothetical protein